MCACLCCVLVIELVMSFSCVLVIASARVTELCLNNCSYPNGICTDGECECKFFQNPYNRTRPWRPWEGPDCSYSTYTPLCSRVDANLCCFDGLPELFCAVTGVL